MKLRKLAPLLLVCLLSSCASPPPPATPMTFANFNSQANHEKQISLEGYLRLPSTTLVTDTIMIKLCESTDPKSKSLSFSLPVGSGANQVEKPPKDYGQKDLKLHANDGSLVDLSQKVRVSGKLIYSADSSILFAPVDVQKI